MKVQGMSLPVMLVTAIGIILLLGFTVWQRMLNNP
jgi:UDP-GlcNAc:undecaprenyl-phosphate GlcNAc-1-phosphate transferase